MWLKYTLLWAVGRVGVLLADVPSSFRCCLTRLLWGGEDQSGLGNETVASLMFALTSLHKHKKEKTYLTSYSLLSILKCTTTITFHNNKLIAIDYTLFSFARLQLFCTTYPFVPGLNQQTLSILFSEDQYKDVTGRPCLAFDLCCSKSKNQRSSLMQLCGSGMIYDAAEQLNESTMSLPAF